MQTRDWSQIGPFTLYRDLGRPAACCTFFYAVAIYCIVAFSSVPYDAEIDTALVGVALFLLGYMGYRLGIHTREDTVSPLWRFGELVASFPALWVSLAYVIYIYKGQLTIDDMTLPYLSTPMWQLFFSTFSASYFTGRYLGPILEELSTKRQKKRQGKDSSSG